MTLPHRIAGAVGRRSQKAANWWFTLRHEVQPPAYFARWVKDYPSLKETLEDAYLEYTTQVSSPRAAISLQLACFLYFVCEQVAPRIVLDLGSGFSSYVLRRFQLDHDVKIYSVDDKEVWLERTRDFLVRHQVGVENLLLWDVFSVRDVKADLILHDMGNSEKRVAMLPMLPRFAAPESHIILDDLHKPLVRRHATRWVGENSLRYVNLAPYTLDSIGRFQWYVPIKART